MTELPVKTLHDGDEHRWNDYVLSHSQGTFFHLGQWARVIRRAFGHKTHYLYVERAGQIVGVLPLAEVRSKLFGHALISTPFCVYGGILAREPSVAERLQSTATELAQSLAVQYLEIRDQYPQETHWPTKSLYVTFQKEIHSDSEKNLLAIPKKQRAMVRKGIKAGLQYDVTEQTDVLFQLYSQSVRNLGTPVFGPEYLRILKETFGASCEVLIVRFQEKNVAAVMNFYFKDQVLPYYGGGTVEARALRANDFMYWAVMEQAIARQVRLFDFGRSKIDTGSYRFKKHWGFVPQPLPYRYFLVKAKALPNLSPTNPKYRIFIETWKRLPVSWTRVLGPPLARNLG